MPTDRTPLSIGACSSLASALPVPLVVVLVKDHRLVAANPAARRALRIGRDASDLGSLSSYLSPENLDALASSPRLEDAELVVKTADGEDIVVRSWFRPVEDASLGLLLLWTFVDSSRRRQVQEELARQNAILRSVVQSIGEGVVVANSAGQFTLWNDAATRLVGIGPVDAATPEWSDTYGVFLPDGTPYLSEELPLARAIRGEAVTGDVQLVRNAMRPEGVWLSVNGSPLRAEDGSLHGGVVVFRDVSLEKAEQARLETAR